MYYSTVAKGKGKQSTRTTKNILLIKEAGRDFNSRPMAPAQCLDRDIGEQELELAITITASTCAVVNIPRHGRAPHRIVEPDSVGRRRDCVCSFGTSENGNGGSVSSGDRGGRGGGVRRRGGEVYESAREQLGRQQGTKTEACCDADDVDGR